MRDADALEGLGYAQAPFPKGDFAIAKLRFDVFLERQVVDQVEDLEYETDRRTTHARELRLD